MPANVDEPLNWLDIEMVLVAEIDSHVCPICLDLPRFPRFTRCGHIYCHPCILQYFQTSESTIAMGSNWRACPVCAEPVHLKQLRPVHFCPATEAKVGQLLHTVLLEKPVGGLVARPFDPSLRPSNSSLATLSPFARLIPVSQQFVIDEIWSAEVKQARLELKALQATAGETLETSFMESALKAMEEKRKVLKEAQADTSSPPKAFKTHSSSNDFYYFHQSRDGLNVFLHPLCMKILRHAFTNYQNIPAQLSLPVLQCERLIVDNCNRKRFKYLDHLPLGTQIILAEVDLGGCVSAEVMSIFARELGQRRQARQAKSYNDSHITAAQRPRSILEEWQQMEDDYYWGVQASAAVDIIAPPEMVKLDDLADEASFPLPSSLQRRSGIPITHQQQQQQPRRPSIPSSHSFAAAAASPPTLSFSDLASSLSSPFYHNPNVSNSGIKESSPSSSLSSSPTSSPTGASFADALELSPVTSSATTNSKKKIVLFSNNPLHRR